MKLLNELKLSDDKDNSTGGQSDEHESGLKDDKNDDDSQECDCKPILVADDNEFNLFTLQ